VKILRYRQHGSSRELVGLLDGDQVAELDVSSLASLWALRLDDLRERLGAALGREYPLSDVEVLAPIDGRTEVWACGVTYEISREARVEESERAANLYELVYDAARPELFFKSAGWRVVADGGEIAVRADSTLDVPEPEVALVINAFGAIRSATTCRRAPSKARTRFTSPRRRFTTVPVRSARRCARRGKSPTRTPLVSSSLSAVAVLSPGRGRQAQPSSTGGTKKWSVT
jgi:2-dehydro-3-deoxy-D-arabinonate dehydratase